MSIAQVHKINNTRINQGARQENVSTSPLHIRAISHAAALNPQSVIPKVKRLCVHLEKGMKVIDPGTIKYCMSESNYTRVCLITGEEIVLSKTLKWTEGQLAGFGFLRPHASFIVNPAFVCFVQRDRMELVSKEIIPVSRRKYQTVINYFSNPEQ